MEFPAGSTMVGGVAKLVAPSLVCFKAHTPWTQVAWEEPPMWSHPYRTSFQGVFL